MSRRKIAKRPAKTFPAASQFLRPSLPPIDSGGSAHLLGLPEAIRGLALNTVLTDEVEGLAVHVPFEAAPAEQLTDEQRAIAAAGRTLQRLMQDKSVKAVIESMIAFRRAYVVAYRELLEVIDDRKDYAEKHGDEFSEVAGDFAIQYAMYEASKPFSEHTLMGQVINTVLPWMTTVIDRHTQADENEQVIETARRAEERKTRAVPIGFDHTPGQDVSGVLTRDRSLVLYGWRPAVQWLIAKAETAAMVGRDSDTFAVIRFGLGAAKISDQHHSLTRVDEDKWKGCANTRAGVATVMGTYVADQLSQQPDLVICDHLPAAFTGGIIARPPGAAAGEAHRVFRAWCNAAGTAFLGGIGMPDNDFIGPLEGPEWEQLKTFSCLRPVYATPSADDLNYEIRIGNHASVFTVPKEVLDNYTTARLIVPATGETA